MHFVQLMSNSRGILGILLFIESLEAVVEGIRIEDHRPKSSPKTNSYLHFNALNSFFSLKELKFFKN